MAGSGILGMIVGFYNMAVEYKTAPKCPKCKWPMYDDGWIKAINETNDVETGHEYKALAVRIHKCPKCGVERHQLIDQPVMCTDMKQYNPKMKKCTDYELILRYGISHTEKYSNPRITATDYCLIKENIIEKIAENNLQYDFDLISQDMK